MAAMGLGTLTLDLIAKIAGFTGPLSQAEREMKQRTDAMNKMAYDFGNSIGKAIKSAALEFVAFAGVTVGVGTALESVRAAIDRADKLNDFTQRLGVSAEQMSGWGYAAKQTGTDIDALGVGFKKLQAAMTDGLDAKSEKGRLFAALGVSVTDASGKMKKLEQIVPEIADKFSGLTDDALKTKIAIDLFGKSGTDLMEFLSSGSGGLKDMTDRAKELGIVIDQETASAADNFNDKLTDLHAITQGWAQEVASALLPSLNALVSTLVDTTKGGTDLKEAANGLVTVFTYVIDAGAILGRTVKEIGTFAGYAAVSFGNLADAANAFGKADFSGVSAALDRERANLEQFKKESAEILGAPLVGATTRDRMAANSVKNGAVVLSSTSTGPSAEFEAIARAQARSRNRKLYDFFGGQDKPGKTKKPKADHTDERIADELARMQDAQEKWADQLVKKTNPIAAEYSDRLRQIGDMAARATKIGVPKDQIDKFTESMKKLAGEIQADELKKFQQEFNDQTAEMAAQMAGPAAEAMNRYKTELKKVQEQLDAGLISQQMFNDRVKQLGDQKDFAASSTVKDLQEQIALIQMTNEQQETYIALKHAGVTADSEWGKQIVANMEQLQKLAQVKQVADDVGNAFGDMFVSIADGSKKPLDALKSFFNDLEHIMLQWIAKQLAEKVSKSLMDMNNAANQSSASGGGSGSGGNGFWGAVGSILSSWLGSSSGRASGGAVGANTLYRVNENGPELLSVSGKDYLMMGSSGGYVTPNNRLGGGGGFTQIIQNTYQAPTEPRTQQQMANKAGYEARRAMARNG